MKANTCILCGNPIKGKKTIEHIFPKMSAEFCLDNARYAKMREYIGSELNKGVSHGHCNRRKDCMILSHSDIDRLFIPYYQKEELHLNRDKYDDIFQNMPSRYIREEDASYER